MNIVGNILVASITVLIWIIFIRLLIDIIDGLTSVNIDRKNAFISFFFHLSEPFFIPFQRILPKLSIGLDVSCIFAIASLIVIQDIIRIIFFKIL